MHVVIVFVSTLLARDSQDTKQATLLSKIYHFISSREFEG